MSDSLALDTSAVLALHEAAQPRHPLRCQCLQKQALDRRLATASPCGTSTRFGTPVRRARLHFNSRQQFDKSVEVLVRNIEIWSCYRATSPRSVSRQS
jgi:hypothetical protein